MKRALTEGTIRFRDRHGEVLEEGTELFGGSWKVDIPPLTAVQVRTIEFEGEDAYIYDDEVMSADEVRERIEEGEYD